MTDYLDPEAPSPDPHAEDDRPRWDHIYVGEGQPNRCRNCGQIWEKHDPALDGQGSTCRESFLRQMDGDR